MPPEHPSNKPAKPLAAPAPSDHTVLSELEDRIHDLETAEEQRFGTFTRLDWIVCTIGSLLLPYLLIAWFWP